METISVKDLRFALRAIDEIYGLTDKDIQITGNKNSFRLIFFFMQRKITVDKEKTGITPFTWKFTSQKNRIFHLSKSNLLSFGCYMLITIMHRQICFTITIICINT